MPVDYGFLQGAAPSQQDSDAGGKVTVTIRVDADCFLQCDGEFVDVQLEAGKVVKTELLAGQHLLEFMSVDDINIKVEKVVDFPNAGKSYLLVVNELKALVAPPAPETPEVPSAPETCPQKPDPELLKKQYLNACKRAYEDYVLDPSEKEELERYRLELGLDETTANELLEQVMRNAPKTELSGQAKIKLKQLTGAINNNEVEAILQQIGDFESIADKFANDELQYKYYLVLSALCHEKCIKKYESSKINNYWKSFWTYLAYLKANKSDRASEILFSLSEKYSNYPEDNTTLLAAAGSLIKSGKDAAKNYLSAVAGDYSTSLQRFAEALYTIIDPKTAKNMSADKNTCAFFFVHLFGEKVFNYHPKTKEELIYCIKDKINKEGLGTKDNLLDLNDIDTSEIVDMRHLFDNGINGELKELSVNGYFDISKWDVSNVKDMSHMFGNSNFNGNISNWDVSNVEDMDYMFWECNFNGDISQWDVSNVKDMSCMFRDSKFNGDISNWDVSNVKDMNFMFCGSAFNGNVSKWDVSNVKDMDHMFCRSKFNGDISDWDVSNVKDMTGMFHASRFNGDISQWDVSNVGNMFIMFDNCPLESNPPKWYKRWLNS